MTVNTNLSRTAQNGDATSSAFIVPFYFLLAGDLLVYVGGVLQTLTTHYAVTGAGNPAGGTVNFVTPPPAGTGNVVIVRDAEQLQSTKYPANDPFPARTHETALDKLTMLVQRTRDMLGRCFALANADTSGASLTVPIPQAGYLLGRNSGGNGLANFANTGGGSTLPLPVSLANGGTGVAAGSAAAALSALGGAPLASPALSGTPTAPTPLAGTANSQIATTAFLKATSSARSSNTILASTDARTVICATGMFTQTFTAAATLGDGWSVDYRNDGTGIITLDPNGVEQIDGQASINLYRGESCRITCNGSAFKTVGRGTGLVLIDQKVANTSATLDFTQGIDGAFDEYLCTLAALVPTTNDAALNLRFSEDGGTTNKARATDYTYNINVLQAGTNAPSQVGSPSFFVGMSCSNAASDGGWNGETRMFAVSSPTAFKFITGFVTNFRQGTGMELTTNSGRMTVDTGAVNAIRLLASIGNLASGSVSLYVMRKS